MKIDKQANNLARTLFRYTFADNGENSSQLSSAKAIKIVRKILQEKPKNYRAILKAYKKQIANHIEKNIAVVESATPIAPVTEVELQMALRKKHGENLEIIFKQNPDLIAGVRVKIGSDVWDGSVKGKINRLKNQIQLQN